MQVDVRTPSGAAWTAGETVRVTVRFAGPVSYTPDTPPEERPNWDKVEVAGGTPTIRLLLGDRERRTLARTASYVGGSGTNTLVFEYEVTAGDGRVGAVEVEADSLVGAAHPRVGPARSGRAHPASSAPRTSPSNGSAN